MKFLSFITFILSISLANEELKPFNNSTHSYTHAEVVEIFQDVLVKEIKSDFKKFTAVFFKDGFGRSPHGVAGLVSCWNCFYNHMNNVKDKENSFSLQLKELYERIAGHQKRVRAVDLGLYSDLQEIEEQIKKLFPEDYENYLPNLEPINQIQD